jgi:hypothetical protein
MSDKYNEPSQDDVDKHVYGAPNPVAKKKDDEPPAPLVVLAFLGPICFTICFVVYTIWGR